MNIYIPIIPIGLFLLFYLMVGATLALPLHIWSYRFISGGTWKESVRRMSELQWLKICLGSAVAWPVIVIELLRYERKYGIWKK